MSNDINTTSSSDVRLFYNDASFYCSALTALLCFVGLIGNIISAIIFSHTTMKAPINSFLTALSIVDACVSFLALPVFVIPYLDGHFSSKFFDPYYPYVVVLIYPLSMTVQTLSVWILVLVTVERYVAVCHPFVAGSTFILARRPKRALVVALVLAFLYNMPRFWEYTFDDRTLTGYRELLRSHEIYYMLYYTSLYLLTHYFVPFLLLFYLSIRILLAMRLARKERMERLQNSRFERQHTSHMVVIIAVSFFLCNSLCFVLNIWEAGDSRLFEDESTSKPAYFLLTLSNTLIIFNSSITFVIYYCFCKRYRRLLWSLSHRIFRYKRPDTRRRNTRRSS